LVLLLSWDKKAIARIDGEVGWFISNLRKKVGNGVTTQFWRVVWVGSQPLKEVFPRLFSVAASKDLLVSDAGSWVGGWWCWAVEWRRNLFEWELELYQNLLEVICGTSMSGAADNWVWIEAGDGVFSVKSCYNLLSRLVSNNSGLSSLDCFVFKNIWRSSAPSKVCAFAWQATIDKIPSRVNLAHRGIIKPPESKDCAFCRGMEETSQHLFLHCNFASGVWYAIFNWLGFAYISPPNISISLACMAGMGVSKRRKKGLLLLWQVVLWWLWRARNDRIFSNKEVSVLEVVESIKYIS
jgi:hypothetical protein